MTAHIAFFVLGLIVLAGGAELFIRGAVRIARRFGVSPYVIGLTLVGFGTSAPELVVNLSSVVNNQPDLATGNVVGSNISNVGLILGLAAVVRPMAAHMRLIKVEVPIVLAVSAALWVMALDGDIGRVDGAILLAGFVVMILYIARSVKAEPPGVKKEFGMAMPRPESTWVSLGFLVLGLGGLVGGAELMVRSAVEIATSLGVSELVIGLTIVAVGTSLPEMASTLAAAVRGESDIAIGNVVGSNAFNVLLILGTTAAISPLPVGDSLLYFDLPAMLGFAVALFVVVLTGLRVRRWEGAILLAGYAAFIAAQVVRAGDGGW